MNRSRIFPHFFSWLYSMPETVSKILDEASKGPDINPFPTADAQKHLNTALFAKTDRQAMIIIGETFLIAAEYNSNNIMRLRNRQERHEFGNKVCFWIFTAAAGIGISILAWLLRIHWGV